MARINLLPWRETQRKKRQQDFLVMLVIGVLLAVGGMAGWHFYNEGLIEQQTKRNNFLKREIATVDERIRAIEELEKTKAQLLARMNVIQQLQGSRPEIVHLMDELVTTLPDGAFLVRVTQRGNLVDVEGWAQSNARVSSYMRNIEASQWLQKPELRVIENKEQTGTGLSHFQLTAMQKSPHKRDEE